MPTYVIKNRIVGHGEENLFRVSPLRRVEPILFEEEGHTRKTRVPLLFVSVNRKTRTHLNNSILYQWVLFGKPVPIYLC